ncbi:MAG: outer membrane beta-barrel protein [Planctomycetes bacterium]|nr:outer membrane beta-barrel protein [Planctomycetota bacterium]
MFIKARKSQLAGAIIVLCFCCSAGFALDPLGSASDKLQKGQFGIGVDYSDSDIDFKAKGRSNLAVYNVTIGSLVGIQSEKQRLDLDGVEVQKAYANLGYGITDNLEAFLRLGAADADWRDDGDTHFSFGLRTGVTFYQKDALRLSALAQYSWVQTEFDSLPLTTVVSGTSYPLLMSGRLSMHEIQIAMGPTYELTDNVSLYGGGFFHLMDGTLDLKGSATTVGIPQFRYDLDSSYDIDQVSELGVYIGARIKTANNISYSIEYQHTNSADAIAMRLLWKF